jgi:hypothetical membrane protein
MLYCHFLSVRDTIGFGRIRLSSEVIQHVSGALAPFLTVLSSRPDSSIGEAMKAVSRGGALALAGILGPVWFTTLVILQGFLLPEYSQVRLPISALAAWPTGWIQILNFCVFGALTIVFAFGLHLSVQRTPRGGWGFALLVASGVGLVMAGVFPWKMVNGVPTETPAHVAGAITTFAAAGLGMVVFSRRLRTDPRWRDLSTYTMATGIAVLLLFVTVGFFAVDDGTPLHPWAGLIQRVLAAVWFTWVIVLASRLRRLPADSEPHGVAHP